MTAETVAFASTGAQAEAMPRIVRHLKQGGLIACPTETVYGFSCAIDPEPLRRLRELKQRDAGQPFLLLVRDASDVAGAVWTEPATRLAVAFWPGPLTLVLPASSKLPVHVRGPGGTIAIRATSHAGMRLLLRAWRKPLTSTSANRPKEPPAISAAAVRSALEAVRAPGHILILDGGELPPSAPSTIVDCSKQPPRLLREGAIATEDLERIIHDLDTGRHDRRDR